MEKDLESSAAPVDAGDVPESSVPQRFHFRCRKCTAVLFRDDEIVPHVVDHEAQGNKAFKRRFHEDTRTDEGACTNYFLDPDVSPWVSEESRQLHQAVPLTSSTTAGESGNGVVDPDTIYCFKCRAKVGTQSWRGSQCSCGAWITPAFKIHSKAVDKIVTDS